MFKKSRFLSALLICMMAVTLITACFNDDDENPSEGIEILGTWTSNYGEETFTNTTFTFAYSSGSILEYDNINNYLFYKTSSTDEYNPDKFGKIVWTEPINNSFFYCTLVFGKDTLDEVKNDTAVADSSDPENSGCNGFPWTKLTK